MYWKNEKTRQRPRKVVKTIKYKTMSNRNDWRAKEPAMDGGYKCRVIEYVMNCVTAFAESDSGIWVQEDCAADFVKVCNVFGLNPCGGMVDYDKEMQYFYK